MQRKRPGRRTAACFLAMTLIFSGMTVKPSFAVERNPEMAGEPIINHAGNAEMKAYGESLLNGGKTFIADDGSQDSLSGTVYYIDSVAGDDSNPGTTESQPWKSIDKVNSSTYLPGDRILFKAGSVWENTTLSPKGSGEEGKPIIIGAYGSGEKPRLEGNAEISDVIYLYNQEYWEIRDLEITNTAAGFTGTMSDENGYKLKDIRGIRVAGQDGGTLNGFYLHDLYVHDVTGLDAWISGEDLTKPGILGKQGWDKSKRTGGILFEILEPATNEPTTFSDIKVERNVINNNSFGGIITKQWKGDDNTGPHWASREEGAKNKEDNYYCENWKPHTNIIIRDNYLSQENSDYACDTIYLTSVQDALVEGNVSKEAGTAGIELYYADQITIQRNEVYLTRAKAGGADSCGIDPDKATTNILIQYNYVHDTGDGILLCGFVFGTTVVRYNVIKDAEKRYINPHGASGVNYIYNNILYNTIKKSKVPFVDSSGGNSSYLNKSGNMYHFFNNIFYNEADSVTSVVIGEGNSTTYDNNCYYGAGIAVPAQDINPVKADPLFEGSVSVDNLEWLRLKPESPLLDAGKEAEDDPYLTIKGNGGVDFSGEALVGEPDIGVFEYQGESESGILNGYVEDLYGSVISGAAVKISGTEYEAVTDQNGFFSIPGMKPGIYEAVISKDIYEDGTMSGISVAEKQVTRTKLKLGECLTTVGTIEGVVSNLSGPLAGVRVTANLEEIEYTSVTDGAGFYEMKEIPVGEGYVITSEKEGYLPGSKENIKVLPGTSVTVDFTLSKDIGQTKYLLAETFDEYEEGDFSSASAENYLWSVTGVTSGKSSVRIEAEDGDKYLKLSKTGKCDLAVFNKENLDLSGIVTIETRVKRTNQPVSANQFGIYSYNSADFKVSAPVSSPNPIATVALYQGSLLTHNKPGDKATIKVQGYDLDQWYIVRNVVNLDEKTFDFYVDDMETPKLAAQPLRTQGKKIDKLLMFASSTHLGDLLVDYVKVCEGPAVDYDDAGLAGIKVNGKDALLKENGDYEITVSSDVNEVTIRPETNSKFIRELSVNGKDAMENEVMVPITSGDENVAIHVLAEDNTTEKVYQLNIIREDEVSLAYLTNLSADGVKLSPDFDFNTMEYEAEADAETDEIILRYETVRPDNTVSITVNRKPQDSNIIKLKNGRNTINIDVGSADGTSFSYYVLTVTRAGIEEQAINGIKVERLPDKTVYVAGEEFEATGLSIGGYAGNELVRMLSDGEYTLSGTDFSEPGIYEVIVMYIDGRGESFKAGFEVKVYDPEAMTAESIKVVKQPEQSVYTIDEEFNTDGMDVRLLLKASGSNALPYKVVELQEDEYVTEYDFSKPGERCISVNYRYLDENGEEKELSDRKSVKVTVIDGELEYYTDKIKVIREPEKLVYEPGSDFDPEGMEVKRYMKASGSNAAYWEEISDYEIDPESCDFSKKGSQKVRVLHVGMTEEGKNKIFSSSVSVTITDSQELLLADGLEAIWEQTQDVFDSENAEYWTEEEKKAAASQAAEEGILLLMEKESVEITQRLADWINRLERVYKSVYPGSTVPLTGDKNLTAGIEFVGLIFNSVNSDSPLSELRIEETEVPESLPEVKSAKALKISMMSGEQPMEPNIPLYVTMKIPNGFDRENLLVYHYRNDEEIEVIIPAVHKDSMSFTIKSLSTFIIADAGEDEVTAIEITSLPNKLIYTEGEALDTTGLTVMAVLESGRRTEVADYILSGFESAAAGKKRVTVAYGSKSAYFDVEVFQAPEEDPKPDHGGNGSESSNRSSSQKSVSTVNGNWKQDNNGWWYEKFTGGYLKSEWAKINGSWYYFNDRGYMAVGWVMYQNEWYYLNSSGAMIENNWIYDKDHWYFLEQDGTMASKQWIQWKEKWYYMNEDGSMASNTEVMIGYRLGADGAWINN